MNFPTTNAKTLFVNTAEVKMRLIRKDDLTEIVIIYCIFFYEEIFRCKNKLGGLPLPAEWQPLLEKT